MLDEVAWAEDGTYRYGDYFSPEKFFNDCLENSNEFLRKTRKPLIRGCMVV